MLDEVLIVSGRIQNVKSVQLGMEKMCIRERYIVDAVQCKSLRQLHHRSGNVGEAEGFVAFLARCV